MVPAKCMAGLRAHPRVGSRALSLLDVDGVVTVMGIETPRSLLRWAPDSALPKHLLPSEEAPVTAESPLWLFLTASLDVTRFARDCRSRTEPSCAACVSLGCVPACV
jgi:hypothetical protein